MALLTAALALAALSWLLPLVVATRDARVPVPTPLSRLATLPLVRSTV